MNSTTIHLETHLNNVQIQMVRFLLTPIYLIGNLNNLANILVFSQGSLKSNVCSWYFIGASISHIFYLNMGCLSRVIWAWTQFDLIFISVPYCIARLYFVLDGLTISRYLLCLIAIDRWIITSRNVSMRQRSSRKTARQLIIGGIFILIIVNIFIPAWYIYDKKVGCGPPTTQSVYTIFYTIYNIALSLAPLFILILFSILTLFNTRSLVHHQVRPTTQRTVNHEMTQRRRHHHKKDVQFMKLSLIQVAGYVLFNTLHGYNTIYGIVTQDKIKTPDQRVIDAFSFGVGLNLHYTYTGITFFLYTIASITFRKACVLLWKRWSERLSNGDLMRN